MESTASNANKHIPKGGMCATCMNAPRTCYHLEFDKMPVIKKDKGLIIVKCTDYKRENK